MAARTGVSTSADSSDGKYSCGMPIRRSFSASVGQARAASLDASWRAAGDAEVGSFVSWAFSMSAGLSGLRVAPENKTD